MKTFLRRPGIPAGLALFAAMATQLWGRTAFKRLVQSDVEALLTGSSAGEARLVSEAMLDGLPEPVQRYLQFTGSWACRFVCPLGFPQTERKNAARERDTVDPAQSSAVVLPATAGLSGTACANPKSAPGPAMCRTGRGRCQARNPVPAGCQRIRWCDSSYAE
jgi:hypothetical protein